MGFNAKIIAFQLMLYLLAYSSLAVSNSKILSYHSPTPGGIAIIKFSTDDAILPIVSYRGSRVLLIKEQIAAINKAKQQTWFAVIGIPLSVKIGTQYITIHSQKAKQQIPFMVKSKSYQTENITISYKGKAQVSPAYELRVLKEFEEIKAIYRNWLTLTNLQSVQLQLPIKGRKTSTFGLKRYFNGVAKRPHSGLDIAAPEGTPVRAPKAGIVIKTSYFCLTGNAVFLDHGQGFITSYFHLKSIAVKEGQHIKPQQLLGYVGKTGRVTGPHLHWSVSLNGVRVDPELFVNSIP